jgi:hypothetical protein
VPAKSGGSNSRRSRPATTPEGRESQLISLAYDLVEKRIREGSATSQEVTHFLKLGSTREKLEQQKIEHENILTKSRIDQLASQARVEELYKKALDAMRTYSGHAPESMDQADEYDG